MDKLGLHFTSTHSDYLSTGGSLLSDTSRDVRKRDESLVPGDESRVLGLGVDSLREKRNESEQVPTTIATLVGFRWDRKGRTNQGMKARYAIVTLLPTRYFCLERMSFMTFETRATCSDALSVHAV